MPNWSEKDKEALEESINKLKILLEPPKNTDKSDVGFFKDLFNIKEDKDV